MCNVIFWCKILTDSLISMISVMFESGHWLRISSHPPALRYCIQCIYYTLSWWRQQIETFSALLAICAGIHRPPVNSPHKGQWRGALMFSWICFWINGWVNNREVGDLRRYDVTVVCVDWDFISSVIKTSYKREVSFYLRLHIHN